MKVVGELGELEEWERIGWWVGAKGGENVVKRWAVFRRLDWMIGGNLLTLLFGRRRRLYAGLPQCYYAYEIVSDNQIHCCLLYTSDAADE